MQRPSAGRGAQERMRKAAHVGSVAADRMPLAKLRAVLAPPVLMKALPRPAPDRNRGLRPSVRKHRPARVLLRLNGLSRLRMLPHGRSAPPSRKVNDRPVSSHLPSVRARSRRRKLLPAPPRLPLARRRLPLRPKMCALRRVLRVRRKPADQAVTTREHQMRRARRPRHRLLRPNPRLHPGQRLPHLPRLLRLLRRSPARLRLPLRPRQLHHRRARARPLLRLPRGMHSRSIPRVCGSKTCATSAASGAKAAA